MVQNICFIGLTLKAASPSNRGLIFLHFFSHSEDFSSDFSIFKQNKKILFSSPLSSSNSLGIKSHALRINCDHGFISHCFHSLSFLFKHQHVDIRQKCLDWEKEKRKRKKDRKREGESERKQKKFVFFY